MKEEFNVPELEPNKLNEFIDRCLASLSAQVSDTDQLIADSLKFVKDCQEMLPEITETDVITNDLLESSVKSIQDAITTEQARIEEYERGKAELNFLIIQFETRKGENAQFIYKRKNQKNIEN